MISDVYFSRILDENIPEEEKIEYAQKFLKEKNATLHSPSGPQDFVEIESNCVMAKEYFLYAKEYGDSIQRKVLNELAEELWKKGLIKFSQKENVSDYSVTLTGKLKVKKW